MNTNIMTYYYKGDKEFEILKSGYYSIGVAPHNIFKSFRWLWNINYMFIGSWGEGFMLHTPFFYAWIAINEDWLKIYRLWE